MSKAIRMVSPIGEAQFPKLNEPDYEFDDNGRYSVKLLFTPEVGEEFISKLDELREAAIAEARKKQKGKRPIKEADYGWGIHYDKEGEPTGLLFANFNMTASGTTKKGTHWTMAPALIDSKRNPFPPGEKIWSGSKLKVGFEARPFNTAIGVGLSLRLKAVQVIELVGPGNQATMFDFEEEDGYESVAGALDTTDDIGDEGDF